jgi:hypothetical protein
LAAFPRLVQKGDDIVLDRDKAARADLVMPGGRSGETAGNKLGSVNIALVNELKLLYTPMVQSVRM